MARLSLKAEYLMHSAGLRVNSSTLEVPDYGVQKFWCEIYF